MSHNLQSISLGKMSSEQSKASRYIQLLDQVRCAGDWSAVPELVRKIRKHAPERTCLALAAQSEHAVAEVSKGRSTAMNLETSGLDHLIAPLVEAIENERTFVEDEFQAQVCLGWIYWVCAEPGLAASHLPRSIEQDFAQIDGTGKESVAWTKVCALKASYIKGASLVRTGASAEALETFESTLPMLLSAPKFVDGSSEQRTWTELLLTEFCLLSSQTIETKPSSSLQSEALSAFRAWASFWERHRGQALLPTGGYAIYSDISRRQVWKEYYVALSKILQQSLPYPTTAMATAYVDVATRLQQREELQRVETKYEDLLLKEVQFPEAEQGNGEVEEWADLVIQNWRVLSSWQDQELGHGGRDGLSRRVLDILYRAATKTFHSTSILRHLFTVHLAVGEFDIGFKAFDTYLEIVKKGKARVEKTGEVEQGLDEDETVLKTASECIRALCRYGSLQAAEKAKELGEFFEEWLGKHYPHDAAEDTSAGNGNGRLLENGSPSHVGAPISPQVFAATWRSVGIAKAQWARLTYDAVSRSEMQMQAINSLRNALSPKYNSTDNVDSLFALAMVLAERRELGAAIDVVKRALLPPSPSATSKPSELVPHGRRFARERSLIPLWHLLALLLSARQEFTTAARSCEGAFEQFQDPKNLFGEAQLNGAYRSEHLNRIELQTISEKSHSHSKGVVDEMDDFEKETVLEVKMTQLVLIEVLEGPQVAVNASDELLSLYTRLFGEPEHTGIVTSKTSQGTPPKSSAGTLRSIKGSIFARSRRSARRSSLSHGRMSSVTEKSDLAIQPPTSQTCASTAKRTPTIHVTNENGGTTSEPHHEKLQKRSMSLARKKSHGSVRNRSMSTGRVRTGNQTASAADIAEADSTPLQGDHSTPQRDHKHRGEKLNARSPNQIGLAVSPVNSSIALSATQETHPTSLTKSLPPGSQNMPQKEQSLKPHPSAHQDTRLSHISSRSSSTNPVTRFPRDQERGRRIGILVKVWLLIAGFYRRAEMYDDAKGAIDEAYKLVEGLEMDVSRGTSSSVSIADGGWGSGKSVEELWGDVWSERGYLSNAKTSVYTALLEFEAALTHFSDHPSAIVGLSNILLDIYTEVLPPPPSLPSIGPTTPLATPSQSTLNTSTVPHNPEAPFSTISTDPSAAQVTQLAPLGFPAPKTTNTPPNLSDSHSTSSTALLDRLAARDRAFGLLSGLTKLGTGWNYSEAWFALARAYEEGGQVDKAREVLWWCVELEEGKAVRNWQCVGVGGYVL